MSLPDIYPFATQDGKAIPLDILNPLGLIVADFNTATAVSLNIPEESLVGIVFATETCIIRFDEAPVPPLVDGVFYPTTLLVPAGIGVTSVFPSTQCHVLGLADAGQVFIQFIEKWAGLGLPKQYATKL